MCNGCEYIWTHGGNILDPEDPTKVVVDSPESAAGLEKYKEDESHAAFLRGGAVFLRNWPYVYALVATVNTLQSQLQEVS